MGAASRILLVDDEEDFRDVLGEFLREEGYAVVCAADGAEALKALAAQPFDLLLSDITMPGMKGFELLEKASRLYPHVKRALITAYDIRDYLHLARSHDIGTIIAKSTPFNFGETRLLVRAIIGEDVFGPQHYADGPVGSVAVSESAQVEPAIETVLAEIPDLPSRQKFRHGLGELVINAIYHGALGQRGERTDEWSAAVTLPPGEAVEIAWSVDGEKAAVAVTDRKGRLTKQEVLYWFERNALRQGAGLPAGCFDTHGKGLFITRELNDRLIINIKRSCRTEAVLINYRSGRYDGHRPLWIHEF